MPWAKGAGEDSAKRVRAGALGAHTGPPDRFAGAPFPALGKALGARGSNPSTAAFRRGPWAATAAHPFFRQRFPSTSAICTAFSAAPFLRLSETTHIESPFSTVESWRMRLT